MALSKSEYNDKMSEILRHENTYEIVKKDPSKNLVEKLRTFLIRWKKNNLISNGYYKSMLSSDNNLSRTYGLPKVHKPGFPFRLIVSSINTPLYTIASFFHNI